MQNRRQEQSTILYMRDDVGQRRKILKNRIRFRLNYKWRPYNEVNRQDSCGQVGSGRPNEQDLESFPRNESRTGEPFKSLGYSTMNGVIPSKSKKLDNFAWRVANQNLKPSVIELECTRLLITKTPESITWWILESHFQYKSVESQNAILEFTRKYFQELFVTKTWARVLRTCFQILIRGNWSEVIPLLRFWRNYTIHGSPTIWMVRPRVIHSWGC